MELSRRTFVLGSAAGLTAFSARKAAASANSTIVLALMGANNRGSQVATGFAKLKGVEFAYVCDPDERAISKGIAAATSGGGRRPQGLKDFRKALDDPAVDALVCAAPNHWHAAATILACAAGKHVYVEKPCCQTPEAGERMITAAKNSSRIIQVGTQRRSGPLYREAMERVHSGELGDVRLAKAWYYDDRPSIGHGKPSAPPAWLDYNLWQGPAPEQPFRDNILHYNWHFFWHWGNGEIGNNGVHTVDLCRWALGVDFPSRVTAVGGRYRFNDDQETPDTLTATWECNGKVLQWEGISWSRPLAPMRGVGIELRGTKGSMLIDDGGCSTFDPAGKLAGKTGGSRGDAEHLQNFLDTVRGNAHVNASIEDGHKSALMCHLANVSYRSGQPVDIDPKTGHIPDSAMSSKYWQRIYRPGWFPNGTT
jgi:predicted dehydrogenase